MKQLLTYMLIVLWLRSCSGAGYEGAQEHFSGADKQLATWWWTRAYPEHERLNDRFYKAWLHATAMRDSGTLYRQNSFRGNWTGIGPSQNIGGRILSIAIDPRNSNTIFAGSASGGIWKSVTGGIGANAWQPVRTGLPVLGVSSIIIHPSDPNIIYAGTGEVYRTDTSNIGFNVWKARGTYGIGVIKSTDGGNTWSPSLNRNTSSLFGVQMLEFDPSDPNTVYACATDGLYRTANAGAAWVKILDKIYVSDIAIHPSNSNLLVAAVGNLQHADKGIYRSTNGGVSWTKITAGLPASFEGFTRLDNVSAAPDMMVASIGRSAGTTQNELFRSTDFGASWTVLSNSNHCQYQFWFAHDVAINPSNTSQLLMGGVPLYGFTVPSTRRSIGGVHADIHDIEFDPSDNNTVYVACDGGMYKSTDRGNSFFMINGGLQAVQFYASLAVSPSNPNIIIGGLQDNGVVRYNGTSWTAVAGGDGGPCVFHPTNSSIAFASNDARRVLRSTNSGSGFPAEVLSSWAFAADSRTGFMAPIAISRSNPAIMYVASDNLHKSTSSGTAGSWTGNNYSAASSYIEARHKTAIALAVSPSNANKLYVSTSPLAQYDNDANNLHVNPPPNILKSVNGGASFSSIKGSLPDRFVMDFAISPTNDDSVWIVLGGFGTQHVYVTGNGGATWAAKGSSLPDVPHNAILLDPRDPSIIYVGNDLGVYMSNDNGATWYDYNDGLWDATLVMDLVATSNNKLIAATHGKGVFVSDLFMVRLTVSLTAFNGVNKGMYNELHWRTATETNALAFEMERSMDNGAFIPMGRITVANMPGGGTYNYTDNDPVLRNAGNVLYRLKIVDRNGSFDYSDIVSLRMPSGSRIAIAGGRGQISIAPGVPAQINIYDATGRLIARRASAGNGLSVFNLPKGTYIVTASAAGNRITRKVIVQ